MDTENKTNQIGELPPMRMADVATTMQQLQEDEPIVDVEVDDEDVLDADEEQEGGFIRYNRAFIAKMSLAADNLKAYYNVLKNALLSYKGVKSRVSWCCDSYNCGRNQLAKINVRGNGLIVYLALDATAYLGTKYRYRDVGFKKKFVQVPMQIKVKSKRGLRYAIELVADVMRRFGIVAGKPQSGAYAPERESLELLMQRNLVRVVNQGGADEELPEEPVAMAAEVQEAPVVEPEPVPEPEVAADVVATVDAVVAESSMSDTEARASMQVERAVRRRGNKRCMVNIDVISRAFAAGDVVDIDSLVAKRLVHPACGYLKVCARGSLDKPLTVKANDFSLIAVKMIVLTGGKAVRTKGD